MSAPEVVPYRDQPVASMSRAADAAELELARSLRPLRDPVDDDPAARQEATERALWAAWRAVEGAQALSHGYRGVGPAERIRLFAAIDDAAAAMGRAMQVLDSGE